MKCSSARGLFSAHLDRDLSFEEEGRLSEHLERCPACAAELASMEKVTNLLQTLTPIEPGPDFYDGVRRRIREADARTEAGEVLLGVGPTELVRRWLATAWLRPALGAALGLCAGILVGVNAPQLAGLLHADREPMVQMAAPRTAASPAVFASAGTTSAPVGPLADLDLTHLTALSDSARLESQPEYILEPYMTDPQRGLIPAGGGYGRAVGGSSDEQNDAFITF